MRKIVLSAFVVGALVVGMLPTNAGAVSVKTSYPLLSGGSCTGHVSGAASASVLPDGDFAVIDAFAAAAKKGYVAPTSNKAGGLVAWSLGFFINATCASLNANGAPGPSQNPCVQSAYATGTYAINKGTTPPTGTLSVTFSDAPSINGANKAPANSDPLDGCTATFTVYPNGGVTAKSATGSNMALSSISCPSTSALGSSGHLTMVCENINN